MSIIIPANSAVGGGFNVANSLRFNRGSSDSLSFTPDSTTNRRTFTISFWTKISEANVGSVEYGIFNAGQQPNDNGWFNIQQGHTSDGDFMSQFYSGAFRNFKLTQKISDTNAWYHFVVAMDTTQGTDTNRLKYYINGTQVTSFNSPIYPDQNFDTKVSTDGQIQSIGSKRNGSAALVDHFDGYLSEFVMIDGQQLAPDQFGEFDEDSGIWKPIDVSGLTFGTNGFYLDFENSGALGADVSGNTNNFTVNNLTAIDQSTDTCTNNFATLNPLNYSSVSKTYSFGNTAITASDSNSWNATLSTFAVSSGKWYTEYKITAVGSYSAIGVGYQPFTFNASAYLGSTFLIGEDTGAFGWRNNGATKSNNANGTLSSWTTNDILMIAIDMDNEKLYVGKNGTWENSGNPESGSTGTGSVKDLTAGEDYLFVICPRGGGTSVNFGSPSFAISSGNTDGDGYGNFEYAVPSGYYALNTKNLAEYG